MRVGANTSTLYVSNSSRYAWPEGRFLCLQMLSLNGSDHVYVRRSMAEVETRVFHSLQLDAVSFDLHVPNDCHDSIKN